MNNKMKNRMNINMEKFSFFSEKEINYKTTTKRTWFSLFRGDINHDKMDNTISSDMNIT